MQVRDIMNPSVVTIMPDESATLAARLLSRHNVGSIPVCGEEGGLRGIVTDRDIILRCVAAEEDPTNTLVRDIMTRNCSTVSPSDDAREAARIMAAKQVRRLPVLENGKVVGMVALGDLACCHQYDMEASKALSEISENVHHMA
ncbi:MAG: CBS domain-containing protein [Clostridia bacterium]|nr:CBS domain-containing protein [Clostridia bacterium]